MRENWKQVQIRLGAQYWLAVFFTGFHVKYNNLPNIIIWEKLSAWRRSIHGNGQYNPSLVLESVNGEKMAGPFVFLYFVSYRFPLWFDNARWQRVARPRKAAGAHYLYEAKNIISAACLIVNINIESTEARFSKPRRLLVQFNIFGILFYWRFTRAVRYGQTSSCSNSTWRQLHTDRHRWR